MKPPAYFLKGPIPYDLICRECDGLDCDKCSLSIDPEEEEDNRQNQMQRQDENNYLLYPERI